MIVRDEEEALPKCLRSAAPFVDEIVVIDTGSTDATVDIARQHGARVLQEPWQDDFALARNRSLQEALGEWILVLDADETLEVTDQGRWRQQLCDGDKAGFTLPLVNLKTDGRHTTSLVLRCFRNHPQVRYRGFWHERVDESLHDLAMQQHWHLGVLPGQIVHHGYLDQVVQSRGKQDRDRRFLQRVLEKSSDDPFLLYKSAVHPLHYPHDRQLIKDCLSRSWILLGTLPAAVARRHLFAPEVAALLAMEHVKDGETHLALQLTTAALEKTRPSPNLWFIRGVIQQILCDHEQALLSFGRALEYADQVLEYAPFEGVTSWIGQNHRAESLMVLGQAAAARKAYRQACQHTGHVVNAFFGPLKKLAASSDSSRALRLLAQRIRLCPGDRAAWWRGWQLQLQLGHLRQAETWRGQANQHLAAPLEEHPDGLQRSSS